VAIKERKLGKRMVLELEKLESMPKLVVDGQNIAYAQDGTVFSYEALLIAIEKIYRCGFNPKIVLPQFRLIKKSLENFDLLGVVDYYKKYEVFVFVPGKNQSKDDDLYALYYAYQTNSKIISNDKFRKELRELSEKEPGIWNNWLLHNRIGYTFESNENGITEFVPEELIDNYKIPAYEDMKHESALMKFWEETDLMIANSGESFGWSDLY
jgi:hypothetical protein